MQVEDDQLLPQFPPDGLPRVQQLLPGIAAAVGDIPAHRKDVPVEKAVILLLTQAQDGQRPPAGIAEGETGVVMGKLVAFLVDQEGIQSASRNAADLERKSGMRPSTWCLAWRKVMAGV